MLRVKAVAEGADERDAKNAEIDEMKALLSLRRRHPGENSNSDLNQERTDRCCPQTFNVTQIVG
jgi:hypothetical protein